VAGVTGLSAIAIKVVSSDGDAPTGSAAAILQEIAGLLERLAEHAESGAVDLRSLPLAPADYRLLREVLAPGEVSATVDALGKSRIEETVYPGVWWVTHHDTGGEVIAEQIEVTLVPEILKSDSAEARNSASRLREYLDELGGRQRDGHFSTANRDGLPK
jgi:hydrogenase-1 operon protein HyaF